MKWPAFLFMVFLFLFKELSIAQNVVTDSSATVVSYWQKGDVVHFSVLQTKEKYDNGKLLNKGSSTSMVEFSIMDATSKSYIINWKYAEIKVNGQEIQNPKALKFVKLIEGITFKYQTSELGEFQELLNWKEVQTAVFKVIDSLSTQTTDEFTNALNQTRKIFSSKESIEQLIMKDVQLFHSLYGGEYKLKQKIIQETELANFLGGNPFPAIITIEMTDLNQKK